MSFANLDNPSKSEIGDPKRKDAELINSLQSIHSRDLFKTGTISILLHQIFRAQLRQIL